MENKRQVVVTGIGVVTSLGCNYENVWEKLISGENGISSLGEDYKNVIQNDIYVAGISPEVSFDEFKKIDKRKKIKIEKLNKPTKMLIYSALKALEDADLDIESDCEHYDIGAIVGTGTTFLISMKELI